MKVAFQNIDQGMRCLPRNLSREELVGALNRVSVDFNEHRRGTPAVFSFRRSFVIYSSSELFR